MKYTHVSYRILQHSYIMMMANKLLDRTEQNVRGKNDLKKGMQTTLTAKTTNSWSTGKNETFIRTLSADQSKHRSQNKQN